jgi:hypothetical protein
VDEHDLGAPVIALAKDKAPGGADDLLGHCGIVDPWPIGVIC